MPLNEGDRRFLRTVGRLKVYLLVIAGGVFLVFAFTPPSELQTGTSVLGIALCGVFWLTQRLLSCITLLDSELTRVINVLRSTLTPEQQTTLFR